MMKQAKGEYPNHHYLGKLAAWTLSWLLTVALATFGPLLIWGTDQKIYSLLAILLSAGVGVGMLLANRKYLQSLDELQRRIQLEAMGVTLGVALVGGISYSMLDIVDLMPFDAEISFLVMSIGITYLVSVFAGQMRYK